MIYLAQVQAAMPLHDNKAGAALIAIGVGIIGFSLHSLFKPRKK